jgi:hypothetical protein
VQLESVYSELKDAMMALAKANGLELGSWLGLAVFWWLSFENG